MTFSPDIRADTRFASGMERFRYRAVDRSGKVVAGVVEAVSRPLALLEIEKLSLMPIDIADDRIAGRTLPKLFACNPRPEEITAATRDLAVLINGGLNLDRAILAVAETGELPSASRMLRSVHASVMAGKSLAEALSAHPKSFPLQYVKMVEVAEANGKLSEALALIARERTRSEMLKRRIASALAYPAFLLVAATAVLAFVLTSVVPEFETALAGFQDEAGGQADAIFLISRVFRDNATALALSAILFLVVTLAGSRSPAVRASFFHALGKVPGVRRAVVYERTTVVCSTLSALIASGVDISSALRLVRDLMRDKPAVEGIDRAIRDVRQGGCVADALRGAGVLPAYATHMLHVGERSGEMAASLSMISKVYEDKLERSLSAMAGVIGPAVLLVVSVMIAWIIVSVMSALLSMNDLLLAGGMSHDISIVA